MEYVQERELFGDQAYWKEDDRQFLEIVGDTLPGKSPAYRPAAVERALAADQSGALAHPCLRRTRLPGGQAVVGLHQGALSGSGQEPGAGADHVRPGQSLPSPASIAPGRGEVRLVNRIGQTMGAPYRSPAAKTRVHCRPSSS